MLMVHAGTVSLPNDKQRPIQTEEDKKKERKTIFKQTRATRQHHITDSYIYPSFEQKRLKKMFRETENETTD